MISGREDILKVMYVPPQVPGQEKASQVSFTALIVIHDRSHAKLNNQMFLLSPTVANLVAPFSSAQDLTKFQSASSLVHLFFATMKGFRPVNVKEAPKSAQISDKIAKDGQRFSVLYAKRGTGLKKVHNRRQWR